MSFRIDDVNDLAGELDRLSHLRFNAVIIKNMAQIYNRAQQNFTLTGVGTPVRTGELRISLSHDKDVVGYTKEYAPHVEFGHRTVNGGYVQGRRFLKQNVDMQRHIFLEDLRKELRRF